MENKKRFLYLTSESGKVVYIDPNFIISIEKGHVSLCSIISLSTGEFIQVKHTPERLLELIGAIVDIP